MIIAYLGGVLTTVFGVLAVFGIREIVLLSPRTPAVVLPSARKLRRARRDLNASVIARVA